MTIFRPFLCRVTPYGTPFFIGLREQKIESVLRGLSGAEVCRYYWLLEKLSIHYRVTVDGSITIEDTLTLGGIYGIAPIYRLLREPDFSGSVFDDSTGMYAEAKIDFSAIYKDEDGYTIPFTFACYIQEEGLDEGIFLISLERSEGIYEQRDSYKTRTFSFAGKESNVYLNYSSELWSESEIEFEAFDISATFFQND